MKKTSGKSGKIGREKMEKMHKILRELKQKMAEIDRLREKMEREHISLSASPKKTRILVEEIKIPSLEILREEGMRKK